ncbi:MAG: PAS domain S-box protein, partial [Burkholderiaceae bacterium]
MGSSKFFPQFLLTTVAYFVAAKFSLYLAIPPGNASAIWPSSAIAVCAVLVWGKPMIPAIWLGATFANVATTISFATAAMIGIGNSLEALVAALMIQRFLGTSPYFSLGENVYKFVAIAAVSSVIAALIGVGSLTFMRYIDSSQVLLNGITWWLGDTAGIIIVAPLILTWNNPPYGNWRLSRLAEMALFGALLITISHIIFSALPSKWAMPYVLLTFISWAAFRYGLAGVIRTVAAVSAVAIYDTARGFGPFAVHDTLNESLLMLQTFLSIIWIVGVAEAVLLEQRTRAEKALRDERSDLEIRVKDRTVILEQDLRKILSLEHALKKRENQLAEAQRIAHLGSWEWDIAENTVNWSDELYRIFGIDKDKFVGSLEKYLELIHPDDREITKKVIDNAIETQAPYKFIHRVLTQDGTVKTLIGRGFTRLNENGSVVCMYGTAQDVTELKATEDLLHETERRYQEVVELSPNGIMIIDEWGRYVFANSAALSLCGVPDLKQLTGKSMFDFLAPSFHNTFREKLQLSESTGQIQTFEEKFIHLDGTVFDMEITATSFARGMTKAALIITNNITERKKSERKFRGLLESAPDAMVIVDQSGKIVLVNTQTEKMFGYKREEILGKEVETLIPHRFWDKHSTSRQDFFKEPRCSPMGPGLELYGCRNDGTQFPIEISRNPIDTEEGMLISIAIRDITERKLLDQNLFLAAQVFENSREAILILDKDRKIIRANDAFSAITGYAAHEVVGDTGTIMRSAFYDDVFYQNIWEEVNAKDHWEDDILCRRIDGQSYIASASIAAVRNRDGTLANYIAIFSDITERKEAESRIRFMAEHDFLTRLPSRALLLYRLGQAIAVAKRNGTHLAILFIDLDRFKNINDSMGHNVGDKLLQDIAKQLRKCVRRVDTICRQGGDEFIILLSEIRSVEQAAHIADSVMKVIGLPHKIDEYEINIT